MSMRRNRTRWAWGLTIAFVVALLMGPGPGTMLVNTAEPFLGVPTLYAWGMLWYLVEVAVVVLAYFFVWRFDEEPEKM